MALGSRPANTTWPLASLVAVRGAEVLLSIVTLTPARGRLVFASSTVTMAVALPAIAPIDGGATSVDWVTAAVLPVTGATVTVTFL